MSARALAAAILLCVMHAAFSQDDPGRLRRMQEQEGIDRDPAWRGVLVDWTVLDAQGRSTIYIPKEKAFETLKPQDLTAAQEKAAQATKGAGELVLLYGTPCFLPRDPFQSNLSVPVNLQLNSVSVWDAVKAVLRQVNCALKFGEYTLVHAVTLGLPNVPEDFYADKCVSINANGIAARDAMCMIMAQSPVHFGLQSRNVYRPDLVEASKAKGVQGHWKISISFYDGNQPIISDSHFSPEIARFWQKETDEAEQPAENCGKSATTIQKATP